MAGNRTRMTLSDDGLYILKKDIHVKQNPAMAMNLQGLFLIDFF
jgi:hypothetical protein